MIENLEAYILLMDLLTNKEPYSIYFPFCIITAFNPFPVHYILVFISHKLKISNMCVLNTFSITGGASPLSSLSISVIKTYSFSGGLWYLHYFAEKNAKLLFWSFFISLNDLSWTLLIELLDFREKNILIKGQF